MAYVIGVFLGLLVASLNGNPPILLGIFVGLLFGTIAELKGQISKLQRDVTELRHNIDAGVRSQAGAHPFPPPPEAPPDVARPHFADTASEATPAPVPTTPPPIILPEESTPQPPVGTSRPSSPTPEAAAISAVRNFFATNTIAKVGIVLLFFGVAFLLKFINDQGFLPIELRLIAAALAALGLITLGWKLRQRRTDYALILQGGGIGIFYLTVFAAFRRYELLPASLSFVLLVIVTIAASSLAVLQNARALAILSSLGGFLAPILISTGSGNHVALFSYYALLNFGILGIAWFKNWRVLNFVGFCATFLISSLWGVKYYQPAFFASVEPFVVLFFLTYFAISTLFAVHKRSDATHGIDTSLVFGVPLVTFLLQLNLVRFERYEIAASAVAFGAFYVIAARYLSTRLKDELRFYVQALLFIGIFFLTLAVPFALSGRMTSAVWALEGTALVWAGVRQGSLFQRIFGVTLTLLSGATFALTVSRSTAMMPLLNPFMIGVTMLTIAYGLSAFLLSSTTANEDSDKSSFGPILFFLGLITWVLGGITELRAIVPDVLALLHSSTSPLAASSVWSNGYFFRSSLHKKVELELLVLFVTFTVVMLNRLPLRPGLSVVPAIRSAFSPILLLLVIWAMGNANGRELPAQFFNGLGLLAWPVALGTHYLLLRRFERRAAAPAASFEHLLPFWSMCLVATNETSRFILSLNFESVLWSQLTNTITLLLLTLLVFKQICRWPVSSCPARYLGTALPPLFVWCFFALLWLNISSPADASPLPYLPVLNPLDLTYIFFFMVVVRWYLVRKKLGINTSLNGGPVITALSGLTFIWATAILVRSLHHFLDIPWTTRALFGSSTIQTSLCIYWSLSALSLMVVAGRKARRQLWLAGAALLALVVFKLFTVDLAGSGTLARVISFLGTGALLLAIGYLAPIPPERIKHPEPES